MPRLPSDMASTSKPIAHHAKSSFAGDGPLREIIQRLIRGSSEMERSWARWETPRFTVFVADDLWAA